MSDKLEGSKTYEVPVDEGFRKKIEVDANSYSEAVKKVESAGYKVDPYRFGKEK